MHYYQFFYFVTTPQGKYTANWYLYDSKNPYEERDVNNLLSEVHEGAKITLVGDPIILSKDTYDKLYSHFFQK